MSERQTDFVLAGRAGKIDRLEAQVSKMLADMPTVHERICHDCRNVAWHADNRTPCVLCRKCGSQDTRKVIQ